MKAYYSTAYGGSESSVYGDLPDPSAGAGQVLVEVKAVSINPVDWKIKQGAARVITGFRFPRIFGADFAGIVRKTGEGVTAFNPGDRVYGSRSAVFNRDGALAQLRAVGQEHVRPLPEKMSFEEAASLPVAALTALNGLRKCGVGKGTHVLINGGTGGVGHFAVQIARAREAIVTVTCSEANRDLAISLGADEVMRYGSEELHACNNRFDAIMDAYGKMDLRLVRKLLKHGGTYASTLFIPPPYLSIILTRLINGRRLTSANMRRHPEDWQVLEELYAEGRLRPLIENTFPLERAEDAFDLAVNGKPRGKIIVTVP
ncbi:MAG: NAD(P)-dependent alcohol dehydrogenase [Bacteroidales bacterium]|jgi:NADPH:quinone reductase-like Zn-dependent oxidoreductase|nr:NAD(P)-dependent alcohol dehydrogenase [Bacteroidales bacterium]